MDNLTNDAKFLVSTLYAEYLNRRIEGKTKQQSIYFDDVDSIHQKYMREWLLDDVNFTCFELLNNDFISAQPADDSLFYIHLSTTAIAELEVTFKDKVNNALDFAIKVKSAIPFL